MIPLSMSPVFPQRQCFAAAPSPEYRLITSLSSLLNKHVYTLRHPNTANGTSTSIVSTRSSRIVVPFASNNENSPSSSPPPPPPPPPSPPRAPQRALGVDYGRKHIGLAVSTLGLAPRPLMNMRGGGLDVLMQLAQGIVDAAVTEGCDAIVIGIPVTMQGSIRRRQTDSQQGRRCRNFADAVAALTVGKNLTVYLADERGTTAEAAVLIGFLGGGKNDFMKKKDTVAAALILSTFFQNFQDAVRVRPPGMARNTHPRKSKAPSNTPKVNAEKKKKPGVLDTEETNNNASTTTTDLDDGS